MGSNTPAGLRTHTCMPTHAYRHARTRVSDSPLPQFRLCYDGSRPSSPPAAKDRRGEGADATNTAQNGSDRVGPLFAITQRPLHTPHFFFPAAVDVWPRAPEMPPRPFSAAGRLTKAKTLTAHGRHTQTRAYRQRTDDTASGACPRTDGPAARRRTMAQRTNSPARRKWGHNGARQQEKKTPRPQAAARPHTEKKGLNRRVDRR